MSESSTAEDQRKPGRKPVGDKAMTGNERWSKMTAAHAAAGRSRKSFFITHEEHQAINRLLEQIRNNQP